MAQTVLMILMTESSHRGLLNVWTQNFLLRWCLQRKPDVQCKQLFLNLLYLYLIYLNLCLLYMYLVLSGGYLRGCHQRKADLRPKPSELNFHFYSHMSDWLLNVNKQIQIWLFVFSFGSQTTSMDNGYFLKPVVRMEEVFLGLIQRIKKYAQKTKKKTKDPHTLTTTPRAIQLQDRKDPPWEDPDKSPKIAKHKSRPMDTSWYTTMSLPLWWKWKHAYWISTVMCNFVENMRCAWREQMKEKVSRAGNSSIHHFVTYLSLAQFTICFSYCTLSVLCIVCRIVSQHELTKQSTMAMWPILAQTEKVHIYRKVDA